MTRTTLAAAATAAALLAGCGSSAEPPASTATAPTATTPAHTQATPQRTDAPKPGDRVRREGPQRPAGMKTVPVGPDGKPVTVIDQRAGTREPVTDDVVRKLGGDSPAVWLGARFAGAQATLVQARNAGSVRTVKGAYHVAYLAPLKPGQRGSGIVASVTVTPGVLGEPDAAEGREVKTSLGTALVDGNSATIFADLKPDNGRAGATGTTIGVRTTGVPIEQALSALRRAR